MRCYKRVIGRLENGELIYSSGTVKNPFVAAFGNSGSGKTTFLEQQIHQLVLERIPVLVFNYGNCVKREDMQPDYREWYEKNVKVYNLNTGIPIHLMNSGLFANIPESKRDNVMINQITNFLGGAYSLPPTHMAELRSAIRSVYETGAYQEEGICAIGSFLEEAECRSASSVYTKMRTLLDYNLLSDGEISFDKPIVEFDLNALDSQSQFIVAQILVSYFYLCAKQGMYTNTRLAMVLDEAQHFDFSSGIFYEILTEGRKANMILLFATAESPLKRSLSNLQQCSTKLYFQPAKDTRKLAKLISEGDTSYWTRALKSLSIGEFVAIGDFCRETGKTLRGIRILRTSLNPPVESTVSNLPTEAKKGNTQPRN